MLGRASLRVGMQARKIEVVPLDPKQVARFYKNGVEIDTIGLAGKSGYLTFVVGGITLGNDGRMWGFLDCLPTRRTPLIYRYMKRFLEERRADGVKEIYVVRDSSLSTSQALLTRAGFIKTDEKYQDEEVWVWRA